MNQFNTMADSDPFINKNIIEPYSTGELSGLTFAIKDNIDIANEITGYGSPGWINTHPKPVVNAMLFIPRAMGVNAISGLSCTPQITIPVAEVDGVPVGLSFIAGYGQHMMIIGFCNQLYARCFK